MDKFANNFANFLTLLLTLIHLTVFSTVFISVKGNAQELDTEADMSETSVPDLDPNANPETDQLQTINQNQIQTESQVQAKDPNQRQESLENISRSINLKMILEQGLRQNPEEKTRQVQGLLVDIQQDSELSRFWAPQLQMVFKMDNQRVERLRSQDHQSQTSRLGQGAFGLQIGDYTLFNWGIDHLDYLNNMATLQRKKEDLFEKRRDLKHNLTSLYFQLLYKKSLERIYREHVKHSTFIYRLNREKAPLRRITGQEYLQTRSIYLHAQRLYSETRIKVQSVEKEMSLSIGEALSTSYHVDEFLKFRKLDLSLEGSISYSMKANPQIRQSKTVFLNSQRSEERILKENLPLPKFTINLGSYLHTFSQGRADTRYTTSSGGDNIELRAGINMTWDIIGEKGFLNSRQRSSAMYQKLIAQSEFETKQMQVEKTIRESYRTVLELEEQFSVADPLVKNAQKKFDLTLENYLQKKANFHDLKEALDDLRISQEFREKTKYDHLVAKLDLAKTMGVEDFPGENFENLAVREE